jgi:serine/threonine protein kinase
MSVRFCDPLPEFSDANLKNLAFCIYPCNNFFYRLYSLSSISQLKFLSNFSPTYTIALHKEGYFMRLWRYGRAIERLGQRYRLESPLGSGGVADVCLAWDEHDEREVAIKVIKPDELDQEVLDRFVKDAAQIAQWNHPHILRIYSDLALESLDLSQGSIIPYIVMEYAQGGDLHKRLNPGQPYPLGAILSLFPQLCNTVSYAHAHGIIHRDLKPLNVLFRLLPDGTEQVVLSDFGLAVEIDATHYTYARGGTLPYMAPEQLLGQALPASDIFALGVILYQLCTGRLPFKRTLLDLRPHEPLKPPLPPSLIQPLLPRALDDVIFTALADDPTQRFSDAIQFWESARSALLSAPPPPTRPSQTSPRDRTNPPSVDHPSSAPLSHPLPSQSSGSDHAEAAAPSSEHGNEREDEDQESEDDQREVDDGFLHHRFLSAQDEQCERTPVMDRPKRPKGWSFRSFQVVSPVKPGSDNPSSRSLFTVLPLQFITSFVKA